MSDRETLHADAQDKVALLKSQLSALSPSGHDSPSVRYAKTMAFTIQWVNFYLEMALRFCHFKNKLRTNAMCVFYITFSARTALIKGQGLLAPKAVHVGFALN